MGSLDTFLNARWGREARGQNGPLTPARSPSQGEREEPSQGMLEDGLMGRQSDTCDGRSMKVRLCVEANGNWLKVSQFLMLVAGPEINLAQFTLIYLNSP